MSAVSVMDDDFDEDEAPRPRKRKAPPPKAARSKPARKGTPRRRVRVEEEQEASVGLIAGWMADLRVRTKRTGAFTGAVAVFFAAVAISGVIAGGHVPKLFADTRAAVFGFLAEGGLKLQRIEIAGAALIPEGHIKQLTGLVEGESSIFEADPHEIRTKLLTEPYIAKAQVRRIWPNRIEILIVERRPVALWQSEGHIRVVDREGIPFAAHDPSRFPNLLLVVGAGAATEATRLIDTLAKEPGIRPRVTAAVFVGQRRWNLRLDNGVEVRLPEEGAELALAHLAKLDREQQILAKDIDAIDLRFPDKLIVRLPATSPLSPNKPSVEGRDT
jgi:cell division protein FtsQ